MEILWRITSAPGYTATLVKQIDRLRTVALKKSID